MVISNTYWGLVAFLAFRRIVVLVELDVMSSYLVLCGTIVLALSFPIIRDKE